MNNLKVNKQKAFTLIEMLIVIGIIGVLLPALFSIIFIILQQQARIYRLIETKRQGDYMLTFIKEKITREAGGIKDGSTDAPGVDQCLSFDTGTHVSTSEGGNFIFTSKTDPDQTFSFTISEVDGILTFTDDPVTTSMHNDDVSVSEINFACIRRSTYSQPLISVNFTITFNDPSPTDYEGEVILPYHSKFILR